MMDISELLILTLQKGASDLHLVIGNPPVLRINGVMVKTDLPVLTGDSVHNMIYDILSEQQKSVFEEHLSLDFSLELQDTARFRVNIFYHRRGEGGIFRLIPTRIPTLRELSFPSAVEELTRLDRGLVIVTGPTGSGKSTTLAAMIDLINNERDAHIITIEDPIEFIHTHKRCSIHQREVKVHTTSFSQALTDALREDPDIILVGEMRDFETVQMALTAAETGHLVLSTLHTGSAPKTIDRIIDVFPPHQQPQIRLQLSETLEGIISQTLLPRADEKGRIAALEIMTGTPAIRNNIRESKTHHMKAAIETGATWGMQSLDQHLRTLLKKGIITWRDAYRACQDKKVFSQFSSDAPVVKIQEEEKIKSEKFNFW